MTTAEQKAYARKIECEEDGLYYARYFFKQRTGGKMIVAPHHKVIQQTLDRVIDGEIQRLIINVPPGYTKTTLSATACRPSAMRRLLWRTGMMEC